MFRPLEKLLDVRHVVCGVLTDPSLIFSLSAFGKHLKDDSETLAHLQLVSALSFSPSLLPSLKLILVESLLMIIQGAQILKTQLFKCLQVPSAVLNLSWLGPGPDSSQPYMEPELLAQIQQL